MPLMDSKYNSTYINVVQDYASFNTNLLKKNIEDELTHYCEWKNMTLSDFFKSTLDYIFLGSEYKDMKSSSDFMEYRVTQVLAHDSDWQQAKLSFKK